MNPDKILYDNYAEFKGVLFGPCFDTKEAADAHLASLPKEFWLLQVQYGPHTDPKGYWSFDKTLIDQRFEEVYTNTPKFDAIVVSKYKVGGRPIQTAGGFWLIHPDNEIVGKEEVFSQERVRVAKLLNLPYNQVKEVLGKGVQVVLNRVLADKPAILLEVILKDDTDSTSYWEVGDDYYMYDPYFSNWPVKLSDLDYNSDLGLHVKRSAI